jgi:hypothetical protein
MGGRGSFERPKSRIQMRWRARGGRGGRLCAVLPPRHQGKPCLFPFCNKPDEPKLSESRNSHNAVLTFTLGGQIEIFIYDCSPPY